MMWVPHHFSDAFDSFQLSMAWICLDDDSQKIRTLSNWMKSCSIGHCIFKGSCLSLGDSMSNKGFELQNLCIAINWDVAHDMATDSLIGGLHIIIYDYTLVN